MNSDRPINNLKSELADRAHRARYEAKSKGRNAFFLPYPYDTTGLEHFTTLSRSDYEQLLIAAGFTIHHSSDVSSQILLTLTEQPSHD